MHVPPNRTPWSRLLPCALLTFGLAAALPAAAQWQWVDAQGKKVFSDTAPPPDTPEKNILRRPKVREPGQTPAPRAPVQTAAPAGVDAQLQEKKRRAEAEAAAREQAEEAAREQRNAQVREDNCRRAQRSRATLTSGRMLAHTSDSGQRGFMDEATRQAELHRAESIIASDCGPAPQ